MINNEEFDYICKQIPGFVEDMRNTAKIIYDDSIEDRMMARQAYYFGAKFIYNYLLQNKEVLKND